MSENVRHELKSLPNGDGFGHVLIMVGEAWLDFEVLDGTNRHPWFTGSLKWDECMNIGGVHLCDDRMDGVFSDVLKEIRTYGKLIPNWDGD